MNLSQRQEAMLRSMLDGAKRYDFIDLRTFNALESKGLAAVYVSPVGATDALCHITQAGRQALCGDTHG